MSSHVVRALRIKLLISEIQKSSGEIEEGRAQQIQALKTCFSFPRSAVSVKKKTSVSKPDPVPSVHDIIQHQLKRSANTLEVIMFLKDSTDEKAKRQGKGVKTERQFVLSDMSFRRESPCSTKTNHSMHWDASGETNN